MDAFDRWPQADRAGSLLSSAADDDDGEEAAIGITFRRLLAAAHGLRRERRILAIRAARNWLWHARQALRDKRASAARVRRMQRQSQIPRPP